MPNPFTEDIITSVPQDTESAAEGAGRIRELKRALIERFVTAFKGFPDENPDRAGEALLFPIAGAMVGTIAQRPSAPDREGHIWFATDTGQIYIGNREGEWQGLDVSTFIPPLPAIRIIKITDGQVLPTSGIYEPVEFDGGDVEYEEDGEFFDANVSRTEFIIPESGRYLITAGVQLSYGGGSASATCGVEVNGTMRRIVTSRATANFHNMSFATQVRLSAGDVVRLMVLANIASITVVTDGFTGFEIGRIDRPAIGTAPTDFDEYEEYY